MLRPITHKDIEKLRIWRNDNKDAFFYNKVINKKEQIEWFEGYLKRIDDHLYIIEYQNNDIGCIGYRPFEDYIELYNVILGNKKYLRKGLMSKALRLLVKIIGKEVIVRIVKNNKKAIAFYTKNGFKEIKNDIGIWFKSRARRT